jgi:hypothetical protein
MKKIEEIQEEKRANEVSEMDILLLKRVFLPGFNLHKTCLICFARAGRCCLCFCWCCVGAAALGTGVAQGRLL